MDEIDSGVPAGFEPGHAGDDGVEPVEPDSFDEALERAIARLPDHYRAQLTTVAIVVADWATSDELEELKVHGLYGLYRGIPRTTLAADGMAVPSLITLYRGPLERDFGAADALETAVEETLRHELAHHLGISDARIHEIKGGRWP